MSSAPAPTVSPLPPFSPIVPQSPRVSVTVSRRRLPFVLSAEPHAMARRCNCFIHEQRGHGAWRKERRVGLVGWGLELVMEVGEGKASLPSQRASPNQSWPMTPTDTNSPSPLSLWKLFSSSSFKPLKQEGQRMGGWLVGRIRPINGAHN